MFNGKASTRVRQRLLALLSGDDEPASTPVSLAKPRAPNPAALPPSPNSSGPAETDTRPEPLYRPLNSERREIRLLTILPGKSSAAGLGAICSRPSSSPIHCTLRTVSLDAAPVYECISYRWGDPNDTVDVTLNGERKAITRTLHTALAQFRTSPPSPPAPIPLG